MPHFDISKHAYNRFRDYIDKHLDIHDVLSKVKPCDDVTESQINTEYLYFTGTRRIISGGDVLFLFEDVVFLCKKTGLDSYFVITCWKRQPVPSVQKNKQAVSEKQCDVVTSNFGKKKKSRQDKQVDNTVAQQHTMKTVIDYLESTTAFDIKDLYRLVKGSPFPEESRGYYNYIRKSFPDITREQFIERIQNNPLYQEMCSDLNYNTIPSC